MFDDGSRFEPGRGHVWRALAVGAALASGCATGVDVTDDELAAICADPSNRCTGSAPGTGGTSGAVGNTGGTGLGSSGTGGTTASPGGRGGTSNTGTGGTTNTGTGGSSGSAGTAGTGNTGPQPLAEGECLDQSDLTITYQDRTNGSTPDSEPSMVLGIQNPGGLSFSLADLTIRYWFTADGAGAFSGNIDYAQLGGGQNGLQSSDVSVSFGQEFGSDYAELAFSSTATVGPTGVQEVQLRFHGNPYAPMDQPNDFSFISDADGVPNPNITPYVNGAQVGGCVPIP